MKVLKDEKCTSLLTYRKIKEWFYNFEKKFQCHSLDEKEFPFQTTFIFVFAIVLLFQHLWVPGFFHDGHLYAALGKNAVLKGKWLLPTLSDTYYYTYQFHPPLYAILGGIYYTFVDCNWMSARFFSLLWAFSLLVLFYNLIRYEERRFKLRPSWSYYALLFLTILPPFFKKARSPNIDLPLSFFLLSSLTFYYLIVTEHHKERNGFYWIMCGVFGGLALLMKGPPALILPAIILFHLLIIKKLKILKSPWPWFAFSLSFLIFGLWPFFLWKNGELSYFIDYINKQVITSVVSGRGEKNFNFSTYIYYLLQNAGPFFILSFFGIYKIFKEKSKNELVLLFFSIYVLVLILFSFVKLKYSNYIVPSFPALIALSAYFFKDIKLSAQVFITFLLKRVFLISTLIILIFPITTQSRREVDGLKILDIINYYDESFSINSRNNIEWKVIQEIYPFNNLVNLLSFTNRGNVRAITINELKKIIDINLEYSIKNSQNPNVVIPRMVVLLPLRDSENLEKSYPEQFSKLFRKIIYFPSNEMMVLFSSSLTKKDYMIKPSNNLK